MRVATVASDLLAAANLALAKSIYAKMSHVDYVRRFGFDQAFSEATLALLRSSPYWDPGRGVPFGAYAYPIMSRQVMRAAAKWAARTPGIRVEDRDVEPEASPHDSIRGEEVEQVYRLIRRLPSTCRKVMTMLLSGMMVKDVAAKLRISGSAVRASRNRGIELLREWIGGIGRISR